jgi:hypothetical protein
MPKSAPPSVPARLQLGTVTKLGVAAAVVTDAHMHLPLSTVTMIASGPVSTDPDAALYRDDNGGVIVTTPVVGSVKMTLSAADFAAAQLAAAAALA